MMTEENKDIFEVLLTKSIIYGIILLLIIVLAIISPKRIFSRQRGYEIATSMVILSDENLLLYDYDVYGTEERFNQGLILDVEEINSSFKERNEILAIKVNGDIDNVEIREEYIYITSTETPELNIEYYLVKDMEFNDINIPCRTFIMLFEDISRVANNIYLVLYLAFYLSIFSVFAVKMTRNTTYLIRKYKSKKV
ncbi:hypothetical protein ACAG96_06445 [Candidatus Izemoplasma sp. B36]|uniref:hypothetical protein n=1 Tax=Candidatus Izemoplasma sp. B36 TaxID=3242468 RepID=UPI00355904C0